MTAAQTAGPEKGWLIIDGGGEPDEVKKRFVQLAGGPDANFVLIPTAMSDEEIEKGGFFRGKAKGGRTLGEYTKATSRCCTLEKNSGRTRNSLLTLYERLMGFGLRVDDSGGLLTLI